MKGNQGQLTVAVDLDEVLGCFIEALVNFHNATYGSSLKLGDFFSYTFREVWGGDEAESTRKVKAFLASNYFVGGINVVAGAKEGVATLKQRGFRLVVVTSRQLSIEDVTRQWLEHNFGSGTFDGVAFGNHYGTEGAKASKLEMCRMLGASILIDDSLAYATGCAAGGIRCLLFDLNGEYGWNGEGTTGLPALVKRVHSWEEVCLELS